MEKPNPIYRVAIDYKARDYRTFETEEQAVAFAHELIEADGNHIFMSEKRGYDGKLVLQWMEWINEKPTIVSKTIGIANTKEIEAYNKWEAEERKKQWLGEWKKRCVESYEKVKAQKIQQAIKEQREATMVIAWK